METSGYLISTKDTVNKLFLSVSSAETQLGNVAFGSTKETLIQCGFLQQ